MYLDLFVVKSLNEWRNYWSKRVSNLLFLGYLR